MDCYIGIDLGSTTTKAVFIDGNEKILGKGITNSRSNYEIACEVAREEAEVNARFFLLRSRLHQQAHLLPHIPDLMAWLTCQYALAQHQKQMQALHQECLKTLQGWAKHHDEKKDYEQAVEQIFAKLNSAVQTLFEPGSVTPSHFFRDIASSLFLAEAERVAKEQTLSFDLLIGVFDKAILSVENQSFARFFDEYLAFAGQNVIQRAQFKKYKKEILDAIQDVTNMTFHVKGTVGTGYGRMTLPFPKNQIRSEILCHGLGAHNMFPETRTVLDIGGQDTKAIQVDKNGVVTNFQMNDRCAAGCGRYLGYIADEMNMGVHELGPMAMKSKSATRINSTCTVFAGAELRERLSLGENKEDILAGLHRAIILRAMSLIARSGGIVSEFTFTGGVARNEAATSTLKKLVEENYGLVKTNISPDSIFTGALGAALYANRDPKGNLVDLDLKSLRGKK